MTESDADAAQPLRGVRVLDLTQLLSGPYATQILADLGAEVIKIEQPGGDKARGNGPFFEGKSSYFASLNRGKKSLALNLKNDSGLRVFQDLVRQSQVVVENFRPGVAERLGIGFEQTRQWNPSVIYASCSGFGQTGPKAGLPALDIIIQALAGTMSLTGEPGAPPLRAGFSVADIGAGMYLAMAILAALCRPPADAPAIHIDISMLDTQVALLENAFARFFATGEVPQATGTRHPVLAPFQSFEAADGRFVVAISTEEHWLKFIRAIGHPELGDEAMFKTPAARLRHVDQLEGILLPIFRTRSRECWITRLEAAEVPVARINTVADTADDPDLRVREMFSEVQFGTARMKVVASPFHFNGRSLRALPVVAEFNGNQAEVLQEILHLNPQEITRLDQEGAFA
ncbi:MAG: CoA transferase [Thermaerobacter sp.]|nr:CoA transferase [Thermaerobacter sp.]